jgi:hypothetical protein
VPATAKIAYATSYFDGIHAFDSILKLIDRVPGRAGTARTVTTALEASRSELGFDPKTDFLAGLGPEMAIYVTSLKTGAEGLSAPKEVEGAFVAQVRDHARFSRIVRLLEERISPPPPPRQPNAPAEPAPNPITSEEVGDVTIRSVAVPPMAWALSNDRFYVGTSPSAVREALGLATSAEGNITTTNDWRGASAAQEAARTSVFVADGTRLLDLFQDISAEWKAVAAGMEYLSVATIYRPEGRKQQLVILTSPAN